jgi:tetratricopeptide (TPR) repeat protein
VFRRLGLLTAVALLAWVPPALCQTQINLIPPPPSPPPTVQPLPGFKSELISAGAIRVRIDGPDGGALAASPAITVTSISGNPLFLNPPGRDGDAWIFRGVPGGDEYAVRVTAPGYETAQMFVNLPGVSGASSLLAFHLRRAASPGKGSIETAHFLLAPAAQVELQQGLEDLRARKLPSARSHLAQALSMAPANARLNYLAGLSYLLDGAADKAAPLLERAVNADSGRLPLLLALATLRYQQHNFAGAIETLEGVLHQDPGSWQAQWLLAASNLRLGKYAEAHDAARSALASGQDKASDVELILGEALAGLGKPEEAAVALDRYARQHHRDRGAKHVRKWAKELRHPATAARSAKQIAVALSFTGGQLEVPTIPPPRQAVTMTLALTPPLPPPQLSGITWMPPDLDAAPPAVETGGTCPLPSLLDQAGQGMTQFVTDLQNFSATEEFQMAEITRQGKLGSPHARKFDYMLIVENVRPRIFVIQEVRNGEFTPPNMGTPVVDMSSAALALVFHPDYQRDFEWSCEGLGSWKGQPAWVVYFRQRADLPISRLEALVTPSATYPLALKGRAWLLAKTGRVLHLEADLVEPLPEAQLARDHFDVDYAEESFQTHPVKLWLPEDVNNYIEFREHAYHAYHHFSHFVLFWVGTNQTFSNPKETPAPKPPPAEPHR